MFNIEGDLTTKILDWIAKGSVYGLVFLIPLFFIPLTGIPLDFQKQLLLLLLSMIGLGAFILKVLVRKEIEIKRTFFNYVVLAFILVLGVSTFFSWDPAQSFFGPVSVASTGFISWLSLAVFFFLTVNVFNSTSEVKKLVTTGLGSAFLVGLYGLAQAWGGYLLPWNFTQAREFNTIGNLNTLALFMVALLPLVISYFLIQKKKLIRFGLVGLGLLSFLVAILANYWIIWTCLGVGMISLVVLLKVTPQRINDSWVVLPIVLLVIAFSFALIQPNFPGLPNFSLQVKPTYNLSYRIAKKVITERGALRSALGTGPSTFSFLYALFKPQAVSRTVFWSVNFQNAPSQILGMFSTTGIVGGLTFLFLIIGFGFLGLKEALKGTRRRFSTSKGLEIGLFSSWLVLAAGKLLYPSALSLEFLFWSFMAWLIILILKE